jgi:putative SOS response-associated peptidase YedK
VISIPYLSLEGKKYFGTGCLISRMNTVSILTTAPNEMMTQIHNIALRMPLILHKEDYAKWLSADLSKEEQTVLISKNFLKISWT